VHVHVIFENTRPTNIMGINAVIIFNRSVLAVDRRSRTREQKITSGRSPFT